MLGLPAKRDPNKGMRGQFRTFWNEFDRLFENFDSFFDGSSFDNFFPVTYKGSDSLPKLNITEDNSNYVVEAIVAGIPKDNIKVELSSDNVLSIEADVKSSREEKNDNAKYIRKEISSRKFCRKIPFGDHVKSGGSVMADIKEGILTVKLEKEKKEAPKANRQIKIL